jgi:hypothetical protein
MDVTINIRPEQKERYTLAITREGITSTEKDLTLEEVTRILDEEFPDPYSEAEINAEIHIGGNVDERA